MKSAIFYGSRVKWTNAHKPVHNHGQPPRGGKKQAEYFIRMDTIDGDALTALNKAKPRKGETVLNTVELE